MYIYSDGAASVFSMFLFAVCLDNCSLVQSACYKIYLHIITVLMVFGDDSLLKIIWYKW